MTVQEKPDPRAGPVLLWLGHYSWVFMAGWAAVAVTNNAFDAPRYLQWPAVVITSLWLLSLVADMTWHRSRLCERCIAATPLDPQAAVNRWKLALRLWHTRTVKILLMLTFLGWLTGSIFLPHHGSHYPAWVNAVTVAVLACLAVIFGSEFVHRKLYPWCPWCHWDDGGDEEVAPDLPVDSTTA